MLEKQREPLGARAYWLSVAVVLAVGYAALSARPSRSDLPDAATPLVSEPSAGACPAGAVAATVTQIEEEVRRFDHAQYRLVSSFRRRQQVAYLGAEVRTLRSWSGPPKIERGPFQEEHRERHLEWMRSLVASLRAMEVAACVSPPLETLTRSMRQQIDALRDAALRSEPEIGDDLRATVYEDIERIAAEGSRALSELRSLQLDAVGRGASR